MSHFASSFWRNGILIGLLICVCSCQKQHEQTRSAYYWSTVFELDSSQYQFIRSQQIHRIYLRYFDVVLDKGQPMPNATVQILSPKPEDVEIVPTVFIVNDCLYHPQPALDSLLFKRIIQMSETHELGPVKEIQLDCDWTKQTRQNYFELLERLRKRAKAEGIAVSSTIRLHQLSEMPPPADRGVLMLYNTGDVTRFEGTDPILDMRDAMPYLPRLKKYDLPLSAAYPVFEWRVAFRGDKFIGIIHADEFLPILPSDTIVTRQATPDMVRQAIIAVDSLLPEANDEMIIYDMSKQNIQRFTTNHYEKVFNRHSTGIDSRP